MTEYIACVAEKSLYNKDCNHLFCAYENECTPETHVFMETTDHLIWSWSFLSKVFHVADIRKGKWGKADVGTRPGESVQSGRGWVGGGGGVVEGKDSACINAIVSTIPPPN